MAGAASGGGGQAEAASGEESLAGGGKRPWGMLGSTGGRQDLATFTAVVAGMLEAGGGCEKGQRDRGGRAGTLAQATS